MIKNFLWILLLASGLQTSWAYSLGGPSGNGGDAWQVPALGYGQSKGPKNIGEEYRRNTPVMYYAFDANFFGFFGAEGATSVDGAFTILNSLTNVDNYSKTLVEFPLESRHQNYQALALGLIDLKSQVLGEMMEQYGLANPVQYTWTLHDRFHVGSIACPVGMEYLVVQRNFDYISSPLNQLQYSPYVNNVLYTYQILEGCTTTPAALAVPFSVDPLAFTYSPVAAFQDDYPGVDIIHMYWGDYYTGLTRDDVAGLRYLMTTNNLNWETASSDSLLGLITTNTANPIAFPPAQAFFNINTNSGTNVIGFYYFAGNTNGGFGYGDLRTLQAYSLTNDPATLQAFYTGLVISSVSNAWVWSSNQTYSYSYSVPNGAPYGSPPVLTITTNYQGYWKPYYYYQFANVFTNHIYTNIAQIVTTTVGPLVGSTYGSPSVTNTTVKATNQINGDFFVLPVFQAGFCPLDVIDASHYNVLAFTNYLSFTDTNLVTSTNTVAIDRSVYLVTYFTNYSYLVNPVTCTEVPNATGLYQGIKKLRFVRADYDSLLGQYWQPVTNDYSMTMVTNSQAVTQHFRRVVTTPDFLFSAEDLTAGPSGLPNALITQRTLTFDENNVLPGLAGPGTIIGPTSFIFNKSGPAYYNSSEDVMDGTPYFNQTPGGDLTDFYYNFYYVWASYDGTTNNPVVYPNGTSLENLQNQVLIQVSPASPLPNGSVDYDYISNAVKFTATGGAFTKPYTWTASGLPSGLNLDPNTAEISGAPTQAGTYDFTLILTDSVGRSVQWIYTITINPT